MRPGAQPNPLVSQSFWRDAFAWRAAITPKLLPRIAGFGLYGGAVALAHGMLGWNGINPIHLGYTGGLLAVLLVLRTNAGYDRWWEARRVWGGIVNQSRNLAVKALAFGASDPWRTAFMRWTAAFSHACRLSLRGQREPADFARVLGSEEDAARVVAAHHMPTRIAAELGLQLASARADGGMDGFAFAEFDRERSLLIDYIGACERIHRTPLPRVHSIKLRRFILLYLTAVPLGLATSSALVCVGATVLIAYPLLAIDQIAFELEDPFDAQRESHLPLDVICARIEGDVMALLPASG